MPAPLRAVVSFEEEWRTRGRGGQLKGYGLTQRVSRPSYGRVCLWVRLECAHCDQRLVPLDRTGGFQAPARIRCSQCSG